MHTKPYIGPPLLRPCKSDLRIVIGTAAACAVPLFIGVSVLIGSIRSQGSLPAWIKYAANPNSDLMLIELPLIAVFIIGTLIVAALALRAIYRRGELSLGVLFGLCIRHAALVHTAFATIHVLVIGALSAMSFDLNDFVGVVVIAFLINIVLLAIVTVPLSVLCAFIFRCIAMTRRDGLKMSTFD